MKLAKYSLLLLLTIGMGFATKAQSIPAPSGLTSSYCAGDFMGLVGPTTCTGPFNAGNQFVFELSGPNGSFASPTILATLTQNSCPAITGLLLPDDLPLGLNYQLRIVSTDPVVTGTPSGTFTIIPLPDATITVFNPNPNVFVDTAHYGCIGDSIRLIGPPGSTQYEWRFNGNPIPAADGGTNDTIWIDGTGGNSGNYSLFVFDGLCSNISSYSPDIEFYSPPAVVFSPNQIPVSGSETYQICFGDSLMLQASTSPAPPAYNYLWQIDTNGTFNSIFGSNNSLFRAVIPGDYRVVVTDTLCADTSEVITLIVDTMPNANVLNVTPTILCLDGSTILTAEDTIAGWDYQWQIDSAGVAGGFKNIPLVAGGEDPFITLDTAILPFPTGSGSLTTNIQLIITNGACEATSITIPVQVFGPPNIRIVDGVGASVDTVFRCFGDSALVVATGGLSYIWNGGVSFNANLTLNAPGMYFVEGTGPNGCTFNDTVYFIYNNPTVDAGSDQTINPGGSAQLSATTTADGPTYFWIPTNTVTNFASPNPIAQPSETTTYILAMTDANGCTAYDTVVVNVVADPNLSVSIMNLISPNADGLNDVWDISGIVGGERGDLVIMNRWGSEVYSNPAYNNNWGGTNDGGDELPDGTYYYVLKLPSGTELTGAVTIIR